MNSSFSRFASKVSKSLVAGLVALGVAGTPIAASAQTCNALQQEKTSLRISMAELVADHPGTHVVIGMCAAGGGAQYQKTGDQDDAAGTFAICAGLGCLMTGMQDCLDVSVKWFVLGLKADDLDTRIRQCAS